ncbi:glycosyltransferase family 4 protein [Methanocella arvoryzae]|uniref:Glycosyltransferase (Group 1) n=1 Tax=Methanocella arvoryzae (strain DSM 22066 / NBRC 105507 / MRE50) TaxID=351160 RepID=Q0W812_METAR|nr:glycosyltransferase [Methanocella arvoryzae]CAJ35481.1 glycosyltransferase (group 1) [Methanocella arvoryzae MRE50]
METLSFCLANYSLSKGNGIDVTVAEFAKELARYHNVKIAVIKSDMEVPGVEVTSYPANRPWKMRAVARELDSQRFDYISTNYLPFDGVATFMRTPHLLQDHGVAPLRSMMHNRGEFMLWTEVHMFRLFSAWKAAMVLPISRYIGDGFRRRYLYRGPMEILPSGIEFRDAEPAPEAEKYGRYVLYVGRHTPYKGVDQLIEIFGEARKELGEDVHLVTIGRADPGYGEKLQALARKAGNVHMLGYVPDVWRYYAGATVYATCSAWEGEDRPVIEAQYMRKPAVSFDNCSHPEVVYYGTLAKNREEFKDALVKHLSDAREDPGVRQKVVDRFSTKSTVRQYLDIIKKMENKG